MKKVRWGILSTANIGLRKVTPAILKSELSEVVAVASRTEEKAEAYIAALGLSGRARAYGSYEDLLADPDIDAVYNPVPNHLHVPLTLQAAKAGKHVLCEKPIALDAKEAEQLRSLPPGIVFSEAFMVRHHPQWLRARELARSGDLGELRAIRGVFTYFLTDPTNVRNQADIGGGGIYDIGCYPVTASRFLFDREPKRAVALVDRDGNLYARFPAIDLIAAPARPLPMLADRIGDFTIEIPSGDRLLGHAAAVPGTGMFVRASSSERKVLEAWVRRQGASTIADLVGAVDMSAPELS